MGSKPRRLTRSAQTWDGGQQPVTGGSGRLAVFKGQMPQPIPPPEPIPRRTQAALPDVRYVPGLTPHPGHLVTPPWDPGLAWERDERWLTTLDLFDQRYLWEAHEAWEAMWRDLPAASPSRGVLQGLIQLAAWRLKRHQGDLGSAASLFGRALARLRTAIDVFGPSWRGLDLATLVVSCADDDRWLTLPMVTLPKGRIVRVVGAATVRDGAVLAARRRPDLARGGLWELPGGKVETAESDRDALARELLEELGLTVTVGPWLSEVIHDYGDVAIRLVAYATDAPSTEPLLRDHDAVRWLCADELDVVEWAPADVPLLASVAAWLKR